MTRLHLNAAAAGLAVATTLLARSLKHRRTYDLAGRIVLITGGSRGLGLLLARRIGAEGATVVIAARDPDELERAADDLRRRGIAVSTRVADVSDRASARQLVTDTIADHGHLDVLINNAGMILVGPVDHMTDADFESAMDVHFWGPLHTMRAAIPHMRQRRGGRIVNIASIGGKIAVPHLAPYCASKFALVGLSTTLHAELASDGIVVTTVSPGLMRTGSAFNAQFKGAHRAEFAWFAIADSLPGLSIDGQRAAAQIVNALKNGRAELVVTWPARLAIGLAALTPGAMSAAMALTNALLPKSTAEGSASRSGWQSTSGWAPSRLTRSSERAADANNEVPVASARPVTALPSS